MSVKSSLLLALVLGWAVLIVVHFSLSSNPINQSINQSINQIVNQAAFYDQANSHSVEDHSFTHQSVYQTNNRRSLLDTFKATHHPVKRMKQTINQANQPPPINHATPTQSDDHSHDQVTEPVPVQPVEQQQTNDQSQNQAPVVPQSDDPSRCSPNIDPLSLYSFSARAVDREDAGPGAVVTVQLACNWPSDRSINQSISSPKAYFRIMAVGASMCALDPTTILYPNEQSMTHFIRLPDPSEYSIVVKLMAYNMSDWMLDREWPMNHDVSPEDVGPSLWYDRPVMPYMINITVSASQYPQHRALDYEQTHTLSAQQQFEQHKSLSIKDKPLCFERDWSLAGRWQLGPRHEHITHRWWSDSLWDDYPAIWAPYDCVFDQSLNVKDVISSLKWVSIVGDSNMRSLFTRLCELSGGEVYAGDRTISYMDLPKLCLIDNGSIVTYSSWFVAKKLPIYPLKTFGEQCKHYSEDLAVITKHNTIKGWPNCTLVSPEIAQMEGPGLTYWGYGSHQAEGGANEQRVEYFHQLFNHSYFVFNPTVFALTEDVDVSMIPDKFGSQFIYRNNERIYAVNNQQIDVIQAKVANGTWPVDTMNDANEVVKGWLPIVDVFSPTHAASEVLHGDAVHMWWEVEATIAKFVTHFIQYAPQLKKGNRRVNQEYADRLRQEVLAGPSDLEYKEPEKRE